MYTRGSEDLQWWAVPVNTLNWFHIVVPSLLHCMAGTFTPHLSQPYQNPRNALSTFTRQRHKASPQEIHFDQGFTLFDYAVGKPDLSQERKYRSGNL